MLAKARDRGLYAIINGTDELPKTNNQTITVTVASISMVRTSLYYNYKKSGVTETMQPTVKFFHVSLPNFGHQSITPINVQKPGPYSHENLNLTILAKSALFKLDTTIITFKRDNPYHHMLL